MTFFLAEDKIKLSPSLSLNNRLSAVEEEMRNQPDILARALDAMKTQLMEYITDKTKLPGNIRIELAEIYRSQEHQRKRFSIFEQKVKSDLEHQKDAVESVAGKPSIDANVLEEFEQRLRPASPPKAKEVVVQMKVPQEDLSPKQVDQVKDLLAGAIENCRRDLITRKQCQDMILAAGAEEKAKAMVDVEVKMLQKKMAADIHAIDAKKADVAALDRHLKQAVSDAGAAAIRLHEATLEALNNSRNDSAEKIQAIADKLGSLSDFVAKMDIEMSYALRPMKKANNEHLLHQAEMQRSIVKLEKAAKRDHEAQMGRVQQVRGWRHSWLALVLIFLSP
jgi:hypothetical protein